MARTNATNFSGGLQFPYATAAADLFKKEDVQVLAIAVDQHDHTEGKGVTVPISTNASLLTNGSFDVWQRGNGPFTGNSTWTADRWQNFLLGADTLSVSRDTANVDTGSEACAALTYTFASAGSGLAQSEGSNGDLTLRLRGRTVTFSARVKTSVAAGLRLTLIDLGGSTSGASHTGSGQYETLSVTKAISATTTYVTVLIETQKTGTFFVDNAMLVVGSQPADYAPLHPADDLARCLRYYERLDIASNGIALPGLAYVATGIMWAWPFKTLKAITPTITYATANQFAALNSTGNTITATAIGSFGITSDRATGSLTVTGGLVAGNASILGAATGGTPYIISEGNP